MSLNECTDLRASALPICLCGDRCAIVEYEGIRELRVAVTRERRGSWACCVGVSSEQEISAGDLRTLALREERKCRKQENRRDTKSHLADNTWCLHNILTAFFIPMQHIIYLPGSVLLAGRCVVGRMTMRLRMTLRKLSSAANRNIFSCLGEGERARVLLQRLYIFELTTTPSAKSKISRTRR